MASPKRIAVVDYGSGNLRSAAKALERCGADVSVITRPEELSRADAIVVPGQGAFGDCAKNLRASGLWDPIREWIGADRPFLGICVGYQLLFESSEEDPGVEGLGVCRGIVKRFAPSGLKIPHMGWNTLAVKPGDPLYRGLPDPVSVYFVHSYFPAPADDSIVSATCEYGEVFAAGVSFGRIFATQFHPEKSQRTGVHLLGNFVDSIA